MRIRKVACAEDLLGLQLAEQVYSELDILWTHRFLFHQSGFVERQVLEMRIFIA